MQDESRGRKRGGEIDTFHDELNLSVKEQDDSRGLVFRRRRRSRRLQDEGKG